MISTCHIKKRVKSEIENINFLKSLITKVQLSINLSPSKQRTKISQLQYKNYKSLYAQMKKINTF